MTKRVMDRKWVQEGESERKGNLAKAVECKWKMMESAGKWTHSAKGKSGQKMAF